MFLSGATKLLAYDDTWWQLTALDYHYYTQPLPWWTSWFMHQLPPWFGKVCVAMTLAIEIGVPWLIFCGRRARLVACRAPGRAPARDRLDRQLRLLQPAHHRAVRGAARRSRRSSASSRRCLGAPLGHRHARVSSARSCGRRHLGPRCCAACSRIGAGGGEPAGHVARAAAHPASRPPRRNRRRGARWSEKQAPAAGAAPARRYRSVPLRQRLRAVPRR